MTSTPSKKRSRLKEKAGGGETVVVGPRRTDAAQETIRGALAMGFDRGVLLKSDVRDADSLRPRARWPTSSRTAATT